MQNLYNVKRKDLDIEKYSKALNDSSNYRIYAECWYLDILTDQKWECWIYGDYEVIMPVPLQFKFGIKFVLQPIYCQQLGVFYKEEISDSLFREFEKKLHKYRVRSYSFNEENTERYNPKGEKRVNYILNLNRPYEEIFSNYVKHRRKDIARAEKFNIKIRESDNYENYLFLQDENYKNLQYLTQTGYLNSFLKKAASEKKLLVCDVFNTKDECVASQIFLISKIRRICIAFVRDKKKEKYNASAFVKDYLIKTLAGENAILDFEGSVNPGIAAFMEGFAPQKKMYAYFSNFIYFNYLKHK